MSPRSPAFPEVPTAAESGVDYVVTNWFGYAVPKGTPKLLIDTLRNDVLRAMAAPDVRERLITAGMEPAPSSSPEELDAYLPKDQEKWAQVVKVAKITFD